MEGRTSLYSNPSTQPDATRAPRMLKLPDLTPTPAAKRTQANPTAAAPAPPPSTSTAAPAAERSITSNSPPRIAKGTRPTDGERIRRIDTPAASSTASSTASGYAASKPGPPKSAPPVSAPQPPAAPRALHVSGPHPAAVLEPEVEPNTRRRWTSVGEQLRAVAGIRHLFRQPKFALGSVITVFVLSVGVSALLKHDGQHDARQQAEVWLPPQTQIAPDVVQVTPVNNGVELPTVKADSLPAGDEMPQMAPSMPGSGTDNRALVARKPLWNARVRGDDQPGVARFEGMIEESTLEAEHEPHRSSLH